jgi:hypothetical protein
MLYNFFSGTIGFKGLDERSRISFLRLIARIILMFRKHW